MSNIDPQVIDPKVQEPVNNEPLQKVDDQKPIFDIDNLYKDNQDEFVKKLKESKVWKDVVLPYKDQQVTQGLNTWKEKHLESEIQKKIDEARVEWDKSKNLDPAAQVRAEMMSKFAKLEQEKTKAEIKGNASEMFAKLNMKLGKLAVDDFVRGSQDETNDFINRYYEELKEFEKLIRDDESKKFIKSNNYIPPAGTSGGIPYSGSHEKHAEAIARGETPSSGPEFLRIDNAIEDFINQKRSIK